MPVKIAFVGAGSRSFGPAVVRDILLCQPLAEAGVELALMDIVAEHLVDNAAYARQVQEALGTHASVSTTTDLDAALDGATFVVTAIEVDRYRYWAQDFHIPRRYGFRQVYGENGGPGGIFHALRNIPPMVAIARAMERRCPAALLLNFANPEHRLCEAVNRLTSIVSCGLCHGVHAGQRQVAAILGMDVEHIDSAACGINHWTWFQRLRDRRTGEDLYPRLRQAEGQAGWLTHWHELALGRVLFRRFGLWPSPASNHYGEYIRWADEFVAAEANFAFDAGSGLPWERGEVPQFLYTIDHADTRGPWQPAPAAASPPAERPAAPLRPSAEFAVPIMEAMLTGTPRRIDAVNVPNRGAIPGLPDDMVVEVPAVADAAGLRAEAMQPLPEAVTALLRVQGAISRLVVEAIAERSRDVLLQAVLLDPVVDSYSRAVAMVDEMLRVQQEILPEMR